MSRLPSPRPHVSAALIHKLACTASVVVRPITPDVAQLLSLDAANTARPRHRRPSPAPILVVPKGPVRALSNTGARDEATRLSRRLHPPSPYSLINRLLQAL